MKIDPTQLVNPGIYDYNDKYQQQLARFTEAVRRARFLTEKERRHWRVMGGILDISQLKRAEEMIIDEDLRLLGTKQKLEKIKSNVIVKK